MLFSHKFMKTLQKISPLLCYRTLPCTFQSNGSAPKSSNIFSNAGSERNLFFFAQYPLQTIASKT